MASVALASRQPPFFMKARGFPLRLKIVFRFRLASARIMGFLPARMSSLPTADLLALDTDGLKSRLSKLRRYL